MDKMLYITGSFPRLGDGIGDAAGKLYAALYKKIPVKLVTTNKPCICDYAKEHNYDAAEFVHGWGLCTLLKLIIKIKKENISRIVIEYAGNGYGKDFAISLLPLFIRIINVLSSNQIKVHLRLHEFSMCRFARKLFTYPLVVFSHTLETPSYTEYKILKKRYGNKVKKSMIGSNFQWTNKRKIRENDNGKIRLAFFGGIYPGKGIEKLLKIWSRLEEKYPNRYEYYLLGGFPSGLTSAFDEYNQDVMKRIEESKLLGKITITGFLPEDIIEKCLDEVDIAVLPYEDGLTLRRGSFLAFLGRQIPIVTVNGDEEAKKMFSDADGVMMCSDIEDMFNCILKLSIDNKYMEVGKNNWKFKNIFSWDAIADNLLDNIKASNEV